MASRERLMDVPPGTTEIPPEQLRGLLKNLQDGGLITPIEKNDSATVIRWLRKGNIPLEEISGFLGPKLTPDGKSKFLPNPDSDLTSSLKDFSNGLKPIEKVDVEIAASTMSTSLAKTPSSLQAPQELDTSLRQGPSAIIYEGLMKSVHAAATDSSVPKVTLSEALTNPKAAIQSWRARSEMVGSKSHVQKALADAARWTAEVAALDVRSDLSLSQVAELERKLGNLLPQFCIERGIGNVPPEGSAERRRLLIELNARLAAEQVQAGALVEAVGRAVEKQVELQGQTAKDLVIAKELPARTEAAAQANRAREEEKAEKSRHFLASAWAVVFGAASGTVEGVVSGVENWVKANPKVAVSLIAGTASFVIQLGATSFSYEALGPMAVKSGIILIVTAVGTGIGSGIATRVVEARKQKSQRRP